MSWIERGPAQPASPTSRRFELWGRAGARSAQCRRRDHANALEITAALQNDAAMRVGVGGVLYRDGQLLLGLRRGNDDLYPAKWDIIGGHMEPGETVEQVLVREFEEEVGVRPLRFECLGVWAEPAAERYGEARYHIYVVHEWQGEPRNCSEEHSDLRWFAIAQLESLELASLEYVAIFSHLAAAPVP